MKYVVLVVSQVVDGHAPEGVPHVEVSIVDPGFCRFDGKSARWGKESERLSIAQGVSLTLQNQMLTFGGINRSVLEWKSK